MLAQDQSHQIKCLTDMTFASCCWMRVAMQQMNLSARAYHRMLKLARTIADLAGAEELQMQHLAVAIQ